MKAIGLIPSRLKSFRLPNKALLDIEGLPMIIHVYKRAKLSKELDDVYVCTDSDEIYNTVIKHNGKAILTDPAHINGTDRIAEAASNLSANFFVDIQGDEPLLNPDHIDSVINFHRCNHDFDIILPTIPLFNKNNPNIVKVVKDNQSKILYLSRSDIPYDFKTNGTPLLKHLSIISFTASSLYRFSKLTPSSNEIVEQVELLRAIDHGMSIGTFELTGDSFSVDVAEDYKRAIKSMETDIIKFRYDL